MPPGKPILRNAVAQSRRWRDRTTPARLMHQSEFEKHVGAGNISPSISVVLERAKVLYQEIEQRKLQAIGEGARSTGALS